VRQPFPVSHEQHFLFLFHLFFILRNVARPMPYRCARQPVDTIEAKADTGDLLESEELKSSRNISRDRRWQANLLLYSSPTGLSDRYESHF
jgi:hypothetical protein